MTHEPSGVARVDRDRHYGCFVRVRRTFWSALPRGREGDSAFPVQKGRAQEDTVVDEGFPPGGIPAVDPDPANAPRNEDVSVNQIRCCASADGTNEAGTARGFANVRDVAQESTARGAEADGSHDLRRNRVVTYARQTLHGRVLHPVQWVHPILGLGARLGQKRRGYCQMNRHSLVRWGH